MKPFAFKFALPMNPASESPLPPMEYDTQREMMVHSPSTGRLIIDRSDPGMITGSEFTRAVGDPTRDESSDRW